jgi:hypothetical protein
MLQTDKHKGAAQPLCCIDRGSRVSHGSREARERRANATDGLAQRDRRRRQEATFLRRIVEMRGAQCQAALATGLSQSVISRIPDRAGHAKNRASPKAHRADVTFQNVPSPEPDDGDERRETMAAASRLAAARAEPSPAAAADRYIDREQIRPRRLPGLRPPASVQRPTRSIPPERSVRYHGPIAAAGALVSILRDRSQTARRGGKLDGRFRQMR